MNSRVQGLIGSPWQLSADVGIETILDEDHAAILRDRLSGGDQSISINAKVINIRFGLVKPSHEQVLRSAVISQFCLNYFAVEPGVSLSWACTVAPGRRNQMSVVERFDLGVAPVASVARYRSFKFDKDTKRPALSGLHKASVEAAGRFPGVIMTIDRFCRALSRDDRHDRLVDLCISLESLIEGSNELRFRFSLVHAILAEPDLARRADAFKLFQDFYDARSKVVHGDTAADVKIRAVEARWPELVIYARKSLAYYLTYLSANDRKAWDEHVKQLCLGLISPGNGE